MNHFDEETGQATDQNDTENTVIKIGKGAWLKNLWKGQTPLSSGSGEERKTNQSNIFECLRHWIF